MGKAIEQLALQRGHQIVARIDVTNSSELDRLGPEDVDVAIEFSTPEAAFSNIQKCLRKKWPTVSGTTGWLNHKAEIEALCAETGGAFFYASNYSIGVNLFFRLNAQLAKLMAGQPYQISMDETHHIHKKDAPSGTAITLAEGILEASPSLKGWSLDPDVTPDSLVIRSHREGEAPGTHTVIYSSEIDTITITHEAHSRKGFALGAVIAAEWLVGKAGIFGMNDLLNETN
jgi:4-hydroxy-tetrahydrodipicolinate reductase